MSRQIRYQLWETVSDGSPISPAFAEKEELAQWMTENKCTVGGRFPDIRTALGFIEAGDSSCTLIDGQCAAQAIGAQYAEEMQQ